MAQKIKLSTIGEALGVSTATVSLALRDSPLVAEATKEKIKAHARHMGYIYNRRAASLRTSKSGIIGVVVHDIMNPFYGEILKAIETELDRSATPSSCPTTTTPSKSSAISSTRCCSSAPTASSCRRPSARRWRTST